MRTGTTRNNKTDRKLSRCETRRLSADYRARRYVTAPVEEVTATLARYGIFSQRPQPTASASASASAKA